MTTLFVAIVVIPAKAGIQKSTGFPRIKYGAGPEHHAVQGRLSQARNDKLDRTLVVCNNPA